MELRNSTLIRASMDVCFRLSLTIDLEVEAGAEFGLRAVDGITTGMIGLGQQVRWRAHQFGIPVSHTTEITRLTAPSFFEDSMVKGIFTSFRHEHRFERVGVQTTAMHDLLQFSFPLLLGGWVTERLLVRRRLWHLLLRRNAIIQTYAEREPAVWAVAPVAGLG